MIKVTEDFDKTLYPEGAFKNQDMFYSCFQKKAIRNSMLTFK